MSTLGGVLVVAREYIFGQVSGAGGRGNGDFGSNEQPNPFSNFVIDGWTRPTTAATASLRLSGDGGAVVGTLVCRLVKSRDRNWGESERMVRVRLAFACRPHGRFATLHCIRI